ncbi:MAG: pyruvate formate lyase family protein [Planctomycetota bacterium]
MSAIQETLQISARIQALKQAVLEQTDDLSPHRAPIVVEVYRDNPSDPLLILTAKVMAAVLRRFPVVIHPNEIIVGEGIAESMTHWGFPEFWGDLHKAREGKINGLPIGGDLKGRLQEASCEWDRVRRPMGVHRFVAEPYRDEIHAGVFFGSGKCRNHSVRDFPKLLRLGFRGLLQEVQDAIADLPPSAPDAGPRRVFLDAARIVAEAGCEFGRRYAAEARRLADAETDETHRAELIEIAEVCERVPEHPARTFREAVQALWFGQMISGLEDQINANSLGRIDQFLWPYLKEDLDAGRLGEEDARELIALLWLKLYRRYDVQQAVLGGQTREGKDATNSLTYMMLDVTDALDIIRCLSIRVHRNSPRRLLERAFRIIRKGGGIPFFFNDDAIIPALTAKGISIEDARDYAVIGCVEITIPGKTNPHAVSHQMNLAKCFELALFDGKDPVTGRQLGPQTGRLTGFADMEVVKAAYRKQVEFFAPHAVYASNAGEYAERETSPFIYRSLLTSDCIRRGRDITDGGAIYNYHSCSAIGVPNVADSLAAIERLVFREGRIGLDQLEELLRSNFAGHAEQQQMFFKRAPKYGNDDDEVDSIAAEVASHYCELMGRFKTMYGGGFHVHLFSFVWHVAPFGKAVGALPDGRGAQEPLAYSISPMQGRDFKGLTALFNSLLKMPHHLAAGSSSAIIEIDPALFKEEGFEKVVSLFQSAIARGLGQAQFNVIDAETLEKAQREPDRYRNLAVRVSGFSQKFCLLNKDMQDHIIRRTKHQE